MDGEDILNKIIQEEGSCCWSRPAICALCPMSRLKRYSNGSFMSCIDAINIENLSEIEADKRYKDAAMRLLLDQAIDDILRDNNVIE